MATAEQVLEPISEIHRSEGETFDWNIPPGTTRTSIVAKIAGAVRRSRESRSLEGFGEVRAVGRETGARG